MEQLHNLPQVRCVDAFFLSETSPGAAGHDLLLLAVHMHVAIAGRAARGQLPSAMPSQRLLHGGGGRPRQVSI